MTVELKEADAGTWWDWIANYDQTLANFNQQYNVLLSQADYVRYQHPELQSTYNALVSDANSHIKTLNDLKATRDYVYSWIDWLKSGAQSGVNFLTSAATNTYDYLMASLGLGGLGVAPVVVIGIAAAAAALVLIGYWIKNAYTFNQRLTALQQQEAAFVAAGLSPQDAATRAQQVVNDTLGPAPGSAADINSNLLGIPWTYLIYGAAAIVLGPPIIEALTKGKQ